VAVNSGKIPGKNKLTEFLKKADQVEEFSFLKSNEVKDWIKQKTQEKSGGRLEISAGAVNYLEFNYGKDLWKLNGELEKLVNYKLKNGDKITEDDLNLFCEKSVEVKIFDFIDAIGERNKRKAIELLGFLLENKEDAFYVFSMVVYQLRNIAKVDYFKRKGVFDQAKIAKETGLHPYVVKKTFFGLKNFKTSEIKSIYEACYRLDFSVKTGKMEIRDALKDLIFKI
jgi:DNA polymerase-3 subunit delta